MSKEALVVREYDHWFTFMLITVDTKTKEGTTVYEQHPKSNVREPEADGTWDIVEEPNLYISHSKRRYQKAHDMVSVFPPVFSDRILARLRALRDAKSAVAA